MWKNAQFSRSSRAHRANISSVMHKLAMSHKLEPSSACERDGWGGGGYICIAIAFLHEESAPESVCINEGHIRVAMASLKCRCQAKSCCSASRSSTVAGTQTREHETFASRYRKSKLCATSTRCIIYLFDYIHSRLLTVIYRLSHGVSSPT